MCPTLCRCIWQLFAVVIYLFPNVKNMNLCSELEILFISCKGRRFFLQMNFLHVKDMAHAFDWSVYHTFNLYGCTWHLACLIVESGYPQYFYYLEMFEKHLTQKLLSTLTVRKNQSLQKYQLVKEEKTSWYQANVLYEKILVHYKNAEVCKEGSTSYIL